MEDIWEDFRDRGRYVSAGDSLCQRVVTASGSGASYYTFLRIIRLL